MRRAALAACLGLGLVAPPLTARAGDTVVVRPGDSLSKIAERELGHAGLWPLLYRANRDRIKDPERVYPGQELTVPDPNTAKVPPPPRSEAPAQEKP